MELDDLVCPLDTPESNSGEQLVAARDVSPTNISHLMQPSNLFLFVFKW
jgi:hypothetical protein